MAVAGQLLAMQATPAQAVKGRGGSDCFTGIFRIVEPSAGGAPVPGPVVHAVYGRGGSRILPGTEDRFRAGGDDPSHRGNQQPHLLYDQRSHTITHTGEKLKQSSAADPEKT